MFYIVVVMTVVFALVFVLGMIGRIIRKIAFRRCVEQGHPWEKLYETEIVGGQIDGVRLAGYRCPRCDERRPWNFNPALDE